MRRFLASVMAVWFAATAAADIGTPEWNWSSYGYWGHGYTATYGQTFVGNGELATGAAIRFYYDGCCGSWPFRAVLAKWDDSNARAVGAVLAQGDGLYFNGGCYWCDKVINFTESVILEQGVRYVVFFTVSPTWSSYCCRGVDVAIHQEGSFSQGNGWRLSNQGNQAAWFSSTWSTIGYDLHFRVDTTNDCDGNGIVDAVELAKGSAADCNEDSIIDSCQGNLPQDITLSGTQGPIGTGIVRQFLFEDVVPSDGNVTLTIQASGDLSATHEFLLVSIAGGTPTPIFTGTQSDCTTLSTQFTYTESQFDQFIAGGDLDIRITASGTVDPAACGGASSVSVSVAYRERYVDCNGNGVPDALDICSAVSPDCNSNFIPDACDIVTGYSADLDANAQPDECQFDCNNDHRPDIWQLATGELPDCNLNGLLDVCDLAAGSSPDCNSNGVPDSCDIADRTVTDCNLDGVPDGCSVSSGTVPDCNGNGVPDSCDLAAGIEQDCDGSGVPDDCEIVWQFVSQWQSPFYRYAPLYLSLSGVVEAGGPVVFAFDMDTDMGDSSEYAEFRLNDQFIDNVRTGNECGEGRVIRVLDAVQFNAIRGTSSNMALALLPSGNVDSFCGASGRARVTVTVPGTTPDCNSNSIPDSCDLDSGAAPDCNANGLIDTCEITSGAEDKNANGHLDSCELLRGDLDLDGTVGAGDLAVLLSLWGVVGSPVGDLNGDAAINAVDVAVLLGNWGSTP